MNCSERAWLIAISDSLSNGITLQTSSGILSNMIAPLSSFDHIVQTLVGDGNNESLFRDQNHGRVDYQSCSARCWLQLEVQSFGCLERLSQRTNCTSNSFSLSLGTNA